MGIITLETDYPFTNNIFSKYFLMDCFPTVNHDHL